MTTLNRSRRPWAALVAGLIVCAALATPAAAQQKPTRIAVVDPTRVFGEMLETKELQTQMDGERQRLNAQGKEKEGEIENLRKQRDPKVTRPDSPQLEELNKQLMQKAMEYETWQKFVKLDAERNQKKQMRQLFAKIESATAEVAKQQNYDLVIADQTPKLPDNNEGITFEQLQGVLRSKHILYASDNADITTAVLALLDARYKASGAGGAAPAPAAAPAAPAAAPTPGKK